MAWWLSWLERRPVTAEVVGSNPIRVAVLEESFADSSFFVSKLVRILKFPHKKIPVLSQNEHILLICL